MGTWIAATWLASSLAFGSGTVSYALPGSLDDALGLPEEPSLPLVDDVLDPVVDPIEEVVDEVVDPLDDAVGSVVDPILDEVVDPIVDPIIEELIDPILDPIVDELVDPVIEDGPEPGSDAPPVTGGGSGPSRAPTADTSGATGGVDDQGAPSVPGPAVRILEPTAEVFVAPEVSSSQAAAVRDASSDDDRLVPLLEAARLQARATLPLETGSALSGILAWLSSGPGILRVLAAPLDLLKVLLRAMFSAGSGLAAPFSLLVALVVRRLREPTSPDAAI